MMNFKRIKKKYTITLGEEKNEMTGKAKSHIFLYEKKKQKRQGTIIKKRMSF